MPLTFKLIWIQVYICYLYWWSWIFLGIYVDLFKININKYRQTLYKAFPTQKWEQPRRLKLATKQFIIVKMNIIQHEVWFLSIIRTPLTPIWHAQYDAANVYHISISHFPRNWLQSTRHTLLAPLINSISASHPISTQSRLNEPISEWWYNYYTSGTPRVGTFLCLSIWGYMYIYYG